MIASKFFIGDARSSYAVRVGLLSKPLNWLVFRLWIPFEAYSMPYLLSLADESRLVSSISNLVGFNTEANFYESWRSPKFSIESQSTLAMHLAVTLLGTLISPWVSRKLVLIFTSERFKSHRNGEVSNLLSWRGYFIASL